MYRDNKEVVFEAVESFNKKIITKKSVVSYENKDKVAWDLGFYYEGTNESPARHDINFIVY